MCMVVSCYLVRWYVGLRHYAAGATKHICYTRGESAVDHGSFKNFTRVCKNVDEQRKSDKRKTVYSEVLFPAIETNPTRSTQRVSGESSMVCYLHDFGKSIRSCRINVAKILQNFWLTLVFKLTSFIILLMMISNRSNELLISRQKYQSNTSIN